MQRIEARRNATTIERAMNEGIVGFVVPNARGIKKPNAMRWVLIALKRIQLTLGELDATTSTA